MYSVKMCLIRLITDKDAHKFRHGYDKSVIESMVFQFEHNRDVNRK